MEELVAKIRVIQAGLDLIKKGLIARTWGNVSCRIDAQTFAVTPSGRAYESLTPSDVVICKIEDGSYSGSIKPSSERGVHALIYREYPKANFVIHTHQTLASAVSVMGRSEIPRGFSSDGEPVPIAGYGLPSTKKLCREVGLALAKTKGKAIIMAHHGAVCFGDDCQEAFEVASALEELSGSYIAAVFEEMSGEKLDTEQDIYDDFCKRQGAVFSDIAQTLGSSRREGNGFILKLNDTETYILPSQVLTAQEARIHAEIYKQRPDVSHILSSDSGPLVAAASSKTALIAMLDDFAQIAGRRVMCAESDSAENVVKALGKHAGVLIQGHGALCCAATESDAHAVRLVMEKNACAQIAASLTGKPRPLALMDCLVMRAIYKQSYSKKQ